MAYMDQATTELTKGMTFNSEGELKAWLNENFNAVVEKARALQEAVVEMLLTNSDPSAKALKTAMAGNVYSALRAK